MSPLRPVLAASLALALSPACRAGAVDTARIERRLVAMGTELTVEVRAADRATALAASEAAVRAIEDTERRLSTWRDDSELARLNSTAVGEPCALDASTSRELTLACDLAEATGGAFDPTIGALVRAYDLRGEGRWPSGDELDAALAATGWRGLAAARDAFVRRVDGLVVEEGGFGKGAGLDAAARVLEAQAPRAARIDLGGQVLWFGAADRTLELAGPADRSRAVLVVEAPPRARSAATSGNGELGREVDGRWLGHLLDPRTGRPAADFGALTVFATTALDADALATGLFVLGPDRALGFAAESARADVLVLESAPGHLTLRHSAGLDGRVRAASGFALEPTDDPRRFVLVERDASVPSGARTGSDPSDPIR